MKRAFATIGAVVALATAVPAAFASTDDLESANVGVTVSTDKTSYAAGDLVTYTITATDLGEASATDTVVEDMLPAGATLVSVSSSEPASWSVSGAETDLGVTDQTSTATMTEGSDPSGQDATSFAGRQKVSVVLGDLSSALYNSADQTTATVTIVVRAGSAGTLVNDAMVTAANPDQDQSNNYVSTTSTVS